MTGYPDSLEKMSTVMAVVIVRISGIYYDTVIMFKPCGRRRLYFLEVLSAFTCPRGLAVMGHAILGTLTLY